MYQNKIRVSRHGRVIVDLPGHTTILKQWLIDNVAPTDESQWKDVNHPIISSALTFEHIMKIARDRHYTFELI